jgi:hypothetical protein
VKGSLWQDPQTGELSGHIVVRIDDRFDQPSPNSARTQISLEDIVFTSRANNGGTLYIAGDRKQKIKQHYKPAQGKPLNRDLSEVLVTMQFQTGGGGAFSGIFVRLPGPSDNIRGDANYSVEIVPVLKKGDDD